MRFHIGFVKNSGRGPITGASRTPGLLENKTPKAAAVYTERPRRWG
jgi:hypothetical protein